MSGKRVNRDLNINCGLVPMAHQLQVRKGSGIIGGIERSIVRVWMRKGVPSAVTTMIRIAALCLLLAVRPSLSDAQTAYNVGPCAPSNIPFATQEFARLKVVESQLSLGSFGSYRWLRLENETGKTIKRLLVVVSYLDSDGKLIFSIPFYGAPKDAPPDMLMIHPYVKTVLNHPIRRGEVFTLLGTNLISTRIPPARAEVTLVDADFGDESSIIGGHPTNTDLALLKTPQFFELQAEPAKLPDEMSLVITVNVRGHVTGVEPVHPETISDAVLGQIKSQLMLWSFFPATTRGYAVESELNLLFRFHEPRIPLPRPTCPLDMSGNLPRTFVEVDLQAIDSHRWQVQYGWHFAHGEFEQRENSISPAKVTKGPIDP
jgi:hypothetical protein